MEPHKGRIDPLRFAHPLAIGEMLLTALIWSSSFVGVRVALAYTGPFTVSGIRYLLAFLRSGALALQR